MFCCVTKCLPLCSAAAGPPTDVSAVLVGTRLTVSWKKPEGDPIPTGYVVRYDGKDIIVQPCTIPADNCVESVNVTVTTDATADYEVTVKTVSEGNFDSPPAKVVKPGRRLPHSLHMCDCSGSQLPMMAMAFTQFILVQVSTIDGPCKTCRAVGGGGGE